MVIPYVLIALAVVAVAGVLLARGGVSLPEDPAPGRPLDWPADGRVRSGDLERVRFAVALRGYRMEQVDRVLDDLRATLADLERRLAEPPSGADATEQEPARTAQEPAGTAPEPARTSPAGLSGDGEPA